MPQTQYASDAWNYENLTKEGRYIVHGLSKERLKIFYEKALKFHNECYVKYFKEEINDCRQYVHEEIVKYLSYSQNVLSASILGSPKLTAYVLSLPEEKQSADLLSLSFKNQNTYHNTGFVLKVHKECYIALYPEDIYSPTEAFSPSLGKEKLYGTLDEELERYFNPLSKSAHSLRLQYVQDKFEIYDHLISSPREILAKTSYNNCHNELLVKTKLDCFDIIGVYKNRGEFSDIEEIFLNVMNEVTNFEFTQFYALHTSLWWGML